MSGNRPFGDFLRSRRTRLEPDKNVDRLRRRTPGLKREEVAQRAGISAEWYVKLEQGRAVSPSAETVDALGRALRLNPVEVAHLRSLAAAAGRQPFQREHVPDTLHRLVRSLPEPAYLTGQRWGILAWNDAAAALFGDFGRLVPAERNNLHWMLTDPAARRLFGRTWAEEARRMVSVFRVAHDLWPSDPAFVALVDQVHANCPEFEAWWSEHGVSAPVWAPSTCITPRSASCATSMRASRPMTTRRLSSPCIRSVEEITRTDRWSIQPLSTRPAVVSVGVAVCGRLPVGKWVSEAVAVCWSVRPCVRPPMRLSHVPLAMMPFARTGSRPKARTRSAPAKEGFPDPAVSTGFVHQLPSALPNIVGAAPRCA